MISDELKTEAGQALQAVEQTKLAPAKPDAAGRWLASLGLLVAGNSSADDVRMKIAAMSGLLDDYPAGVFTQGSIKRAAKRFRWFPAFAELAEFLDAEADAIKSEARKLRMIAETSLQIAHQRPEDEPKSTGKLIRDMTQEERDAFFAELRQKAPEGFAFVSKITEDGVE